MSRNSLRSSVDTLNVTANNVLNKIKISSSKIPKYKQSLINLNTESKPKNTFNYK